ncbi:hypothetical protein K469DRAFT_723637 [Zopfia rhizophila CBS 207.26]|uniref:Uncharacterized protein n=1 Tax=Zopfia rhizophila CBS 207.26 TaxID=1314779 RepID=A0A6A6EF87_9PEZI|nr:hypothetical protein K469DRAFT_723637 [Zopfia rhizophila CBS 207.26]
MSLAYKVEELLALRDSVSESAVSIDKFADGDVIKEHVLRPSASACLIGARSENVSRSSIKPGAGTAIANKKPSPSPSIKRGKAEKLLKEHGSPPGMRVTAGGRVVPSDLTPLGSACFNGNNFKSQGPRGVILSNGMSTPSFSDLNKVPSQGVQFISGQAYVCIGNQMIPLQSGEGISQGYAPNNNMMFSSVAPFIDAPKQVSDSSMLSIPGGIPGLALPSTRNGSQMQGAGGIPTATVGIDLQALKQQHALKKGELKHVEQTEVLQADFKNEAWRNAMIEKKKSLILEIDAIRKQINALESETTKSSNVPPHSVALPTGSTTSLHAPTSAFVSQFQQPVVQAMYPNVGLPVGMPPPNPYTSLYMYQPFAGAPLLSSDGSQFGSDGRVFSSGENSTRSGQFPNTITPMTSGDLALSVGRENFNQSPPGSATRRSHAIEIKPPRGDMKKRAAQGSTLDPKSPTYEPATKAHCKGQGVQAFVPPTPSPVDPPEHNGAMQAKFPAWHRSEKSSIESHKHEDRVITQKPSISSISTADFFPTNTHEHSSTRIAPNKIANSEHSSRENTAVPSTPEKDWGVNNPWNPVSHSGGKSMMGGGAFPDTPMRRLTSWNEEFGKQSSGSHCISKTINESREATEDMRKASVQLTSEDGNWSLVSFKQVEHMPSTYQEGYQAGLSHKGLPAIPEVIRGYCEGLAFFLKDPSFLRSTAPNFPTESIASRGSSLRGNSFGVTPHDSAVSLTFARVGTTASTQENVRSSSVSAMGPAVRGASAYSPHRSVWNMNHDGAPITYSLCNEAAQNGHQRDPAKVEAPITTGEDKRMPGSVAENELSKKSQGVPSQTDSTLSNITVPRHFSGNQLGSRTISTSTSRQRYYPTPKDYAPGAANTGVSPFTKPMSDKRYSGLDGAMDEVVDVKSDSNDQGTLTEPANTEASCFKLSSTKGKQKGTSSPTKSPGSPKKSGEHSPAKAQLERLTNKPKRDSKKDRADPTNMSPEDKKRWRDNWHLRFQRIKRVEKEEIEQYKRENPLPKESTSNDNSPPKSSKWVTSCPDIAAER